MALDLTNMISLVSNNIGGNYLFALWTFIILVVLLKLSGTYIIHLIRKIAKKTKNKLDDMAINFILRIKWPFYLYVSFYVATKFLILPNFINTVLNYLLVIFIGYYVIAGLNLAINKYSKYQIAKREQGSGTSMIKVLAVIAKIAIWLIVFLMILSNLGVEITPLVASLGVGGIAVALALQTVLADLFAAFAIYFDKPFEEGDFIIVGDDMGVVKQIGVKTTRIQSLDGQELIVSNSEMTNSRINNYKKMEKRRIAFQIGVEYGTKSMKLKRINKIVENIFKKIRLADLDRVHFKSFGDSSLIYEIVYYLKTSDYTKYMDVQQEVNLAIKDAFEKEKISMAFPTRTVHIKK